MLVMDNVALPALVTVTVCDGLAAPTRVAGNERLAAERVTGAVCPVPLSEMVCGDVVALSVIETVAVSTPAVVGAKYPWIAQLAPTARLVPQLFANTNDDASVPVRAMLVSDSADVPLFVTVTDCEPVASPKVTDPYDRLVAERVTGNGTPVPLSVIACGDVVALSVIVIAATSAPAAVGAKCP